MSEATKPFCTDATPEEKLRTLFQDQALRNAERRKDASTFSQFANSDAAQDAGRFAAVNKATVTGATSAPEYPAQPEGSFSNQAALVPIEEPLGFVDETPIVGEAHEVQASIEKLEHKRAATQDDQLPLPEGRRGSEAAPFPHQDVERLTHPIPTNKRDR